MTEKQKMRTVKTCPECGTSQINYAHGAKMYKCYRCKIAFAKPVLKEKIDFRNNLKIPVCLQPKKKKSV